MSEQAEPTGEKETRELDCALTDAEVRKRAQEFAGLHERREKVEAKLAKVRKQYKDHLGGLSSKFGSLAKVIASGVEKREVRCSWWRHWPSSTVQLRRDDTGEVLESRTMTTEEKQLAFEETKRARKQKNGGNGKRERKGPPKRLPADAGPTSTKTATSDATAEPAQL